MFKIILFLQLFSFSALASEMCTGKVESLKNLPAEKCLEEPTCFTRQGEESNQDIVTNANASDIEILARLVFAESISTNFKNNVLACTPFQSIFDKIANVAMTRVHQDKDRFGHGVKGVVFKSGQFNPAVSKKSVFSGYYICPQSTGEDWKDYWMMAVKAAATAIKTPKEQNTFYQKGLNHVYYPLSTQATNPPAAFANLALPAAQKALNKDESTKCLQVFKY